MASQATPTGCGPSGACVAEGVAGQALSAEAHDAEHQVLDQMETDAAQLAGEVDRLRAVCGTLTEHKELFTETEHKSVRAALHERQQDLADLLARLEAKREAYHSRGLKLRELLGRRNEVMRQLQAEHGGVALFGDALEELVSTQTRLTIELQHAEADMHN